MTSSQAYKTFLLKINKNDTNRNVNISKGNFVLIFNEQKDIWLAKRLETSDNSSEKNKLSNLLVPNVELEKIKDKEQFVEFKLPDDWFEYENSYSIASKGKCSERILYNWDFKQKNKNVLFQDENNNPSFEYEQTLINIANDKLLVFKTDFSITKQYLTYYRKAGNIDIKGYIKIDGSQSNDIDPDIPDNLVNEIINRCAVEVIRSYENPEGFQLAKDRILEED